MEIYTLCAPFGLTLKVREIGDGDFYWAVEQHDVWVCSGEACSRRLAIGLGENALMLSQIHIVEQTVKVMVETDRPSSTIKES